MLTFKQAMPNDKNSWEKLWQENCAHFGAEEMTQDLIDELWCRILDPKYPMQAWIAFIEMSPVGLAHLILHPHTFSTKLVSYLEDLWVSPEARGQGVATKLVEHLAVVAEHNGWRRLYWETDITNLQAQRIYEKIASKRQTLTYEIVIEPK